MCIRTLGIDINLYITQEHDKLDQTSKIIVVILGYNDNEPVQSTHVPLYIYLLKFVFKKLDAELRHTDLDSHTSDITNKIENLIDMQLVVEHNNKFQLGNEGLKIYNTIKDELTLDEVDVIDDFKETLNCLTRDEFLALAYFSHKNELDIDSELCEYLVSKREYLATSMFLKESTSMSKAASIAGSDLESFYDKLLCMHQK